MAYKVIILVIVNTCSDSLFSIGQKNCQLFVAKLRNFLDSPNRMVLYSRHSVLLFPDFGVCISLRRQSLR